MWQSYKITLPGSLRFLSPYPAVFFHPVSMRPLPSSSCLCNAPRPPVLPFSGWTRKDAPWANYIGSLVRCKMVLFLWKPWKIVGSKCVQVKGWMAFATPAVEHRPVAGRITRCKIWHQYISNFAIISFSSSIVIYASLISTFVTSCLDSSIL